MLRSAYNFCVLFGYSTGTAAKEAWLKLRNCRRDALGRQRSWRVPVDHVLQRWSHGSIDIKRSFWWCMLRTETHLNVARADNLTTIYWKEWQFRRGKEHTGRDDSSDEERSTHSTSVSSVSYSALDFLDGVDDHGDTSESVVDGSVHVREIKKKERLQTSEKRNRHGWCVQASHRRSWRETSTEGKWRKETGIPKDEGRYPSYYFFVSQLLKCHQPHYTVKREVFRVVSDSEENLLSTFHLQGHLSSLICHIPNYLFLFTTVSRLIQWLTIKLLDDG